MRRKFILSLALLSTAVFASYADGYKDGVEYYLAGQKENAKTVLLQTINDAQTNKAEAYYYLGWVMFDSGNEEQAEKYFDQGVQANPEYGYNYIGKGAVALRSGDKDTAKDYFKDAEKKDKKDAKIKIDIARAYYYADTTNHALYQKDWEKALKDAIKKDKKNPYPYMFQGDVYTDLEDYGNAAGYYEMAINYAPELPFAYVKYANTYFRINPAVAISKLEEIVAKNPNSALAQRELAEKYYENDQWTKAAEQYKNVIENPNCFPSDEERYVVLLYFGKKYTESFQRAQALLQQNPNSFLMKRMQFLNAAALEDYANAEKYALDFFASGTKDNIYTSNDYTTYGDVLKHLGRVEESLTAYAKAVEVNPEKTELLKELSSAYTSAASEIAAKNNLSADDQNKVSEYYQKATQAYQAFVDKGNYVTNDLYVLAGRYQNIIATTANDSTVRDSAYQKAIEIIDEVLERVPDDYRIPQRKARIQMVYEGPDRSAGLAVDSYNLMINIVENDSTLETETRNRALMEAYTYIAAHYLAIHENATAKEYYLKYLELDPTNEALRNYIENMKVDEDKTDK